MILSLATALGIDPVTTSVIMLTAIVATYVAREWLGGLWIFWLVFPALAIGGILGNYLFQLVGLSVPFDPTDTLARVDNIFGDDPEGTAAAMAQISWSVLASFAGLCAAAAGIVGLMKTLNRVS